MCLCCEEPNLNSCNLAGLARTGKAPLSPPPHSPLPQQGSTPAPRAVPPGQYMYVLHGLAPGRVEDNPCISLPIGPRGPFSLVTSPDGAPTRLVTSHPNAHTCAHTMRIRMRKRNKAFLQIL